MAQSIIGVLRTSFEDNKKLQLVFLTALAVAVGGSAYFGYRLYRNSVQEKAQKILSEAIEHYKTSAASESVDYTAAARMFQEGYDRTKGSTLAPIFLVYEADALARAHKLDEASDLLKNALDQLPKDSPFFDLYKLKKLLIDIDAQCGKECSTIPADALKELERMAYDTSNNFRELALNYLVDFYRAVGQQEEAQKASAELEKLSSAWSADFLGSSL